MSRIAAVVLAGGNAERLGGVNKALLEVGGIRLIDRAGKAIAGCDPRLLSVGRRAFEVDGFIPVRDLEADYGGPLAGLAAAVEALGDTDVELLLSLAVDTPFFPLDFLSRALDALGSGDAVIGAFGPQDYPTNGLWRMQSIRSLADDVRTGISPHSLKRLAEGLGASHLDYAGIRDDDPFVNINTPADMAALTARAMRENAHQMPLGKGNQTR